MWLCMADSVCVFSYFFPLCPHILPVSGTCRQTMGLLYLVCTVCTKGRIQTYENRRRAAGIFAVNVPFHIGHGLSNTRETEIIM